jgi:hypothetical protein
MFEGPSNPEMEDSPLGAPIPDREKEDLLGASSPEGGGVRADIEEDKGCPDPSAE